MPRVGTVAHLKEVGSVRKRQFISLPNVTSVRSAWKHVLSWLPWPVYSSSVGASIQHLQGMPRVHKWRPTSSWARPAGSAGTTVAGYHQLGVREPDVIPS